MEKRNRVYVCFADFTAVKHLRFLKKGFRHCFLVIPGENVWIGIEAVKSGFDAQAIQITGDIDVKKYLKLCGFIVLEAERGKRKFVPRLMTCVGVVKSYLGINSPFIITPHQLYRFLQKREK